jgi:hypothetical protein
MSPLALVHSDPTKPDDRLSAEAAAHLSKHPALQLVAELLTRLREMRFPWWTAEQLRAAYPAATRLEWLSQRPDLRQRITTGLTGLAAKAARNKSHAFQAELIDSVIDEGDTSADAFEAAFEPTDLAVYGPAVEIWRLFRQRMPWDDDATVHKDLIGWLIGALLADKSSLDGSARTPILGALSVRTAIDGRVWHTRIPLDVRVAIDEARFAHQRERPGEPYGVERDLGITTPALIAASIPLKDLLPVLDVAAQALGFEEAHARSAGREAGHKREPATSGPSDDVPGPAAPAHGAAPDDPEVEVHDTVNPPRASFSDEPTSDVPSESAPPSVPEEEGELDHTNPWVVPKLVGDIERVAQELKTKSKKASD